MPMLDQKIQVFLAVAELGSFSRAAVRLSLSTSSVSFHIDTLEKELGVRLFTRHGRSIELTDEGQLLFDRGSYMNTEAQKIRNELDLFSGKLGQRIRLSGQALTCAFRMPWTLAAYKKIKPDVTFVYNDYSPETAIDKLVSGELDVAFLGQPVRNKKLEAAECFTDSIVLVTAADSGIPDTIDAADLSGMQFLVYKNDLGLEQVVVKGLAEAGVPAKNLNIFMEIGSLPILKNFVRVGLGVTLLPRLVVKDEVTCGILKTVNIRDMRLTRTTYRVYRKAAQQPEALGHFIEFVKNFKRDDI